MEDVENQLSQNKTDFAFVSCTNIYNKKGFEKNLLQKSCFATVASTFCQLVKKILFYRRNGKNSLFVANQEFGFLDLF